jgi:hypothetical protein
MATPSRLLLALNPGYSKAFHFIAVHGLVPRL